MNDQITNQEILEAVNTSFSALEETISSMGSGLRSEMNDRFNTMDNKIDLKLAKLKHELLDAIDDKNADLRGDLVVLMRKEDKKVTELIHLLTKRQIISVDDENALLALEPFPR